MRDKRIFNKTIAISKSDKDYIIQLKKKRIGGKQSEAGVLSFIIDYFRKHEK